MRNQISKIILCSLLSAGSLLNAGCSSGGFSALNTSTSNLATPGVATSPDSSSDWMTIPEQPLDPKNIPLTGAAAMELYTALQNSGVVDNSGRLGATKLEASEIECNTPRVPNPVTTCRLYTASSTLNMPPADASKVNSLFSATGGQVNGGASSYSMTKAYSVYCLKVVYPGATPVCAYSAVP